MIGAKRVTAPDGTTWRVGRRWMDLGLGLDDFGGAFGVVIGRADVQPSEPLEPARP